MSSFYLILALIFSLLIAIIALANNDLVTVSYIFGRCEVSLILLILGSAFTGALVIGFLSLFRTIRTAFTFREMRHQQEALRKEIKKLEGVKLYLEARLSRLASVPAEEEEYIKGLPAAEENSTEKQGESTEEAINSGNEEMGNEEVDKET